MLGLPAREEEHDLLLFQCGVQRGREGGGGLADARGGVGDQVASLRHGQGDVPGEAALAVAHLRVGEQAELGVRLAFAVRAPFGGLGLQCGFDALDHLPVTSAEAHLPRTERLPAAFVDDGAGLAFAGATDAFQCAVAGAHDPLARRTKRRQQGGQGGIGYRKKGEE